MLFLLQESNVLIAANSQGTIKVCFCFFTDWYSECSYTKIVQFDLIVHHVLHTKSHRV